MQRAAAGLLWAPLLRSYTFPAQLSNARLTSCVAKASSERNIAGGRTGVCHLIYTIFSPYKSKFSFRPGRGLSNYWLMGGFAVIHPENPLYKALRVRKQVWYSQKILSHKEQFRLRYRKPEKLCLMSGRIQKDDPQITSINGRRNILTSEMCFYPTVRYIPQ